MLQKYKKTTFLPRDRSFIPSLKSLLILKFCNKLPCALRFSLQNIFNNVTKSNQANLNYSQFLLLIKFCILIKT